MATKTKLLRRTSQRTVKARRRVRRQTAARSNRLRNGAPNRARHQNATDRLTPSDRVAPKTTRLRSPRQATARQEASRYVYYFGDAYADGTGQMKPLLGGKGANLAEMTRIALPVPPGFTITTEVCTYFYENKRTYPPQLEAQVAAALEKVEKIMGTKFGDPNAMPLLVAV